MRVYDTSNERKTAINVSEKIAEAKKHLEEEWGVIVVGLTSDAGGESCASRVLTGKAFPELITPDCYGHQVCSSKSGFTQVYHNFDLSASL